MDDDQSSSFVDNKEDSSDEGESGCEEENEEDDVQGSEEENEDDDILGSEEENDDDGSEGDDKEKTTGGEGISTDDDQSKMKKETLNILIVSLRPCIAQAKVHLIHKLTKQVAGLKKKKCANEQEKAKNERKVARFVEEISILKRAKKDMMSRWLAVNKKTFAEVTKKETLTQKFNMKVRVFSRTAEHKAVKKVLDEFKQKFPLWEKEVPKLLRALGKKRKKTDPNMQELGIKPVNSAVQAGENEHVPSKTEPKIAKPIKDLIGSQKEVIKVDDSERDDCENGSGSENNSGSENDNGNENDSGNKDDSDTDSGSDTDDGIVQHKDGTAIENVDSDTEENIFEDGQHEFDKDDPANYSESDVEERSNSEGSDNETDSGDEEIFVNSLKNALKMSQGKDDNELEKTPPIQKSIRINKKSGEMLVKVLDLKKTFENDEDEASDNDSNDSVETENSTKKISSFFVGGESESEEENGDNIDDEPLPYGEDVLQMRQQSLKNKFQHEGAVGSGLNGRGVRGGRGRGDRGRVGNNGHENSNRGRGRGEFENGRGRGGFQQRGRGRGDSQSTGSGKGDWFFQQRGRGRGDFQQRGRGRGDFQSTGSGRGDFQGSGRGKTFTESRGGGNFRQPEYNVGTNKAADVDNNLHPSWAAKKRTNTTIAKFEGKKIKFGDDGDSVKSVKPSYNQPTAKPSSVAGPTEKIHPSWAAKQNQKSSIQAFQGKKVVFGD